MSIGFVLGYPQGPAVVGRPVPRHSDEEPTGPYPEMARLVRAISGGAASRVIQRRTGISHATASTLLRGDKVTGETLWRFATGYRVPLNPLRQAMELPPLPVDPTDPGHGKLEDPLKLIGQDVDDEALRMVPHVPSGVPAAVGRVRESDESFISTGEVLPNNVRTIELTGECMEPLFSAGDILYVQATSNAKNGDTVIALVDYEGITCKVFRQNGSCYLEPMNGKGKIAEGRFNIVGVVVGYYRRMKRQ